MQSKSSSSKATKGSVVVFNSHNRLQLRFRFGGKRRYISLGLADTQLNRRFAELKAAEIEQDILKEKFDSTLEKYRSASDKTHIYYYVRRSSLQQYSNWQVDGNFSQNDR